MNFPPIVRSWLILISIVLSTGIGAGQAAFLTGSSLTGAVFVGLGVAASNVLMNLMKSPSDKAEIAVNKSTNEN